MSSHRLPSLRARGRAPLAVTLLFAGLALAGVATFGSAESTAAAGAPAAQQELADGGLLTLYEHDAVASSISFSRGGHGGRVVEGQLDLSDAQLVYGGFQSGKLTFGFSADEAVNVVDLGKLLVEPIVLAQDATVKYTISAFETLSVSNRRLVYRPAGGSQVRLGNGNEVFSVPRRGLVSFEPQVGNVYALRYQETRGARRDVLAKFQVVEHRPGESVTLRWANIAAL